MLLGGDEIGRTQRGNNNAYCQDNEMSWVDWEAADRTCSSSPAADPTAARAPGVPPPRLVPGPADPRRRRRRHRLVHARRRGDDRRGLAGRLRASRSACSSTARRSTAQRLRGEPIVDDSFLLLFNAHHEPLDVHAAAARVRRALGSRARHAAEPGRDRGQSSARRSTGGAGAEAAAPSGGRRQPPRLHIRAGETHRGGGAVGRSCCAACS